MPHRRRGDRSDREIWMPLVMRRPPPQGDLEMARNCNNCGARNSMTWFEAETFTVAHAGAATIIDGLSGWRCGDCHDVIFIADSALLYAAAGDALVRRARARLDS